MKIKANDIRVGNIIHYNKEIYVVAKTTHTQPGKGGAYVQVEMKNIQSGVKLTHRFRSSEDIEKVRLDQEKYQFLYRQDNFLILMNIETFEQISVNKSLLEDRIEFLKEGMEITLEICSGTPIIAHLPDITQSVVVECDPMIKNQTSTSSYKPAIIENGVRIMVPPFINVGDRILIDLKDITYIERLK